MKLSGNGLLPFGRSSSPVTRCDLKAAHLVFMNKVEMARLRDIVYDLLVELDMDELPPPVAWTMGYLQGHENGAKLSAVAAQMPSVIRDYISVNNLRLKQLLQDYPKLLEVAEGGPGLDAVKLVKKSKTCHYFLSEDGCENGDKCKYQHVAK